MLFGCELNAGLEELREKIPSEIFNFLKIEEKSKNKLMITWESEKDSQVLEYISLFTDN